MNDTSVEARWIPICRLDRLERDRGACALVGDEQIAIFRVGAGDEVYAVSNFDPFSKAFVLSRGIVGNRGDVVKVASPVYKQTFDLRTGVCIEDDKVRIARYEVRVSGGIVEVRAPSPAGTPAARPAPPGRTERSAGPPLAASAARSTGVGPLAGWNIVAFEAREQLRLTEMLEAKGAQVASYPVLAFRDPPELGPVDAFIHALANREFDIAVLLTGEGVKRLLDGAKRLGREPEVIAALGRTRTVTRGPKPARALREVGVLPTLTAEVPTTDGVIETLRTKDLRGSIVGVQHYPRAGNGRLLSYLRSAGADVRTVMPYLYENALGESAARELVERLCSGEIDAVAFTSRAQVERLFDLASSLDLRRKLDFGLNRTRIAALGPVVASSLRNRGHRVSIIPARSFFMKSMVQEIVKAATSRAQPGDERKSAPRLMKNVNGWR